MDIDLQDTTFLAKIEGREPYCSDANYHFA